jgi:hypothetical protein
MQKWTYASSPWCKELNFDTANGKPPGCARVKHRCWPRRGSASWDRRPHRKLARADKITAVKATEYVIAAKGDKDKAREAARKDGWEY